MKKCIFFFVFKNLSFFTNKSYSFDVGNMTIYELARESKKLVKKQQIHEEARITGVWKEE